MLDHVGIAVSNLQVSRRFYSAALAPLGYAVILEFAPEEIGGVGVIGFGVPPKPDFWINGGGGNVPCVHVAFSAGNRLLVDAFHRAAIAAGGRDNGGPGLRPHYHPGYYAAFVIDPDGHNIEAVCHMLKR
jgi:catechol 2,3-dioxygenase-like lactoylglutathione lyase family enzyme